MTTPPIDPPPMPKDPSDGPVPVVLLRTRAPWWRRVLDWLWTRWPA
jgi:hypothetical protein